MDADKSHQESLPPGQVLTRKFPVVGEKVAAPPLMDPAEWRLELATPDHSIAEFTYQQVLQMPRETLSMDVHCVTGWSRRNTEFQGLSLIHI